MPGRPNTFQKLMGALGEFVRRHWQRALIIRERVFVTEEALHLCMAGVIGVLGGLTALVYSRANDFVRLLGLGSTGDLVEIAEGASDLQRLLVPTVGGVVAGLVLYLGLRLLGNPGLSNLLEAVVAGDGKLSLRTALINAVSSLLSISTGASIGREGLIIQMSATLGSKLGGWVRWPPYRLRLMVACGAAAGVAASYNTPIAGAMFAAQIVLGNFSMNLFAPLVVASVVASIVPRSFFGISQWYVVPSFDFTRLSELPWFLILGLVTGAVGAGFLKLLRSGGRVFSKLPFPIYVRMGIAGLIVGVISLWYPQVWGNGYAATNQILGGVAGQAGAGLLFLVGLFGAKLLATTATVGSGTVGGVFTPTLLLGAAVGSFFGTVLHLADIATILPTGVFALAGMAGMLAATTHSPLLAMILIFELSLNYPLMPALMLACVVSTLVARRIHPESVYTEPLRRKGLELQRESARLGAATEKTVGDLMRQPVPPLSEESNFREIARRFLRSTHNFLPVVDKHNRLLGMVSLHDLKEYLHAGQELNSVIAFDVMRPPPKVLTPNQSLPDALPTLLGSELVHVPVVNNLAQNQLVGTVTRGEALSLLSEAISARSG